MPTYVFKAKLVADQFGQAAPLPPGVIEQFALIMPGANGAWTLGQLIAYAKRYGLGTRGLGYSVFEATADNVSTPYVITQIALGQGASPSAQQPVLSPQHIRGGQPTGTPQPQGGQPRYDGALDMQSGFQPLGDAALDGGIDSVYGDSADGTVNDLVIDGGGIAREVPR